MKVRNSKNVTIDADVGFPMKSLGKGDMSFDNYWLTIIIKKKIVIIPRDKIKSIIIERSKDTVVEG